MVYKAMPDAYKAEVEKNIAAGKPINEKAAKDITEAVEKAMAAQAISQN
jgi:hypothetical protein